MGFVVKEIPFGDEVVLSWSNEVVGVGEGFRTCTKEWVVESEFPGTFPDYFADVS